MKSIPEFMKNVLLLMTLLLLASCESKQETTKELSTNSESSVAPSALTAISEKAAKEMIHSAFVRPEILKNSCSSIPTKDEVKTGRFEYYNFSCSRTGAINAGIPVVSGEASYNYRMFVQDIKRYKTCKSTDGTTHLYGQVVRFVIEVSDYSAEFGGSFTALAISGSTKGMTASIYIYSDGIDNTALLPVLASIHGKPFNVDTYKDYGAVLSKINDILADKNTKFSVNEIGVEVKPEFDETSNHKVAPLKTAALYAIQKKISYRELIDKDYKTNNSAAQVILDTYKFIGIPADNTKPTDRNALDAKDYLTGVKIRN